MDKIELMTRIISKNITLHKIKSDLEKIFKKTGVFRKGSIKMDFAVHERWKPNCFVSCTVSKKNNTIGKDLVIIIKPEHSEDRALRGIIQEGTKIISNEAEHLDDGRQDKKVFYKELQALEKDIIRTLARLKEDSKVV